MNVSKDFFEYCLVFSLVLIISLCIPTWAQAATYYVAKNGNDNNTGTETRPWLTIKKAADTMVAGDMVYVKEGTYYESPDPSKSGTAENYISFLAYPGDRVIVDGQGGGWIFGGGICYVKIDGFIIQNANILMGPYGGNRYNIISNNIIANAPEIGVDLCGGSRGNIIENNEIYGSGHGIHTSGNTNYEVIRGNIIHDNSANGLGLAWGTGLQVVNNIVYNNGKTGIEYTGEDIDGVIKGNICYNNDVRHVGSSGGWEIFASGSNFVIEKNTAISPPEAPVTYFIEGSNHIVRNNIGYRSDGSSAGVVLLPSSVNSDYNDWFDTQNADPVRGTPGPHSISQNPLFVNMANHDFHLQPDSPCIGAGPYREAENPQSTQPIPCR
jgi:parallel beta-helix repeat protein